MGSFFFEILSVVAGMKSTRSSFSLLLQRIAWLMLFFSLCRLMFFIYNFSYFRNSDFWIIWPSFFYGLRFDITAIVIANLLFISLHLLPLPFFHLRWFQSVLKILFGIVNVLMLLVNFIDLPLFRFTGKRATADLVKVMSFGNDFKNTVPQMIADFWPLVILFFLCCFILLKWYPRDEQIIQEKSNDIFTRTPLVRVLSFLVLTFLTVIGFRGGMQYRPINILSASQYSGGKDASLILNTPFTIMKTYGKNALNELHYFSKPEAEQIAPTIIVPESTGNFHPLNVFLVILESFGKEYIGSLNNNAGYTPFLDSLIAVSKVYTQAFANGKRSIEGIPAIIAGIPALMTEPYITSPYGGNDLNSIASLLKTKKYNSVFFHGGTNGTMGFDNFCRKSGFDKYFGRAEYGNDADFDGNWGIYDEPFLQRCVSECSKLSPPFFASVFTLSSHHPYSIPAGYATAFAAGTLPIHQSIRYADFALQQFFNTASKQPWFDSTLFVITADHTALSENPYYQSRAGMYAIPILFYCHSDPSLKGKDSHVTQQIDILPGILDYLHYDLPFFSIGKSMLDTTSNHGAINFINDTYQFIRGDYSLILDTLQKNSLYDIRNDSLLRQNIIADHQADALIMERASKAILQNYSDALIHNRMIVR